MIYFLVDSMHRKTVIHEVIKRHRWIFLSVCSVVSFFQISCCESENGWDRREHGIHRSKGIIYDFIRNQMALGVTLDMSFSALFIPRFL